MGELSPLCLKMPGYFLAESMNTLGTMNGTRGVEGCPFQGRRQNSKAMIDEWHRKAVEAVGS